MKISNAHVCFHCISMIMLSLMLKPLQPYRSVLYVISGKTFTLNLPCAAAPACLRCHLLIRTPYNNTSDGKHLCSSNASSDASVISLTGACICPILTNHWSKVFFCCMTFGPMTVINITTHFIKQIFFKKMGKLSHIIKKLIIYPKT